MKSKKFIDDEAEESDGDFKEEKKEANTSDILNCKLLNKLTEFRILRGG
jgi:hypothetical protein